MGAIRLTISQSLPVAAAGRLARNSALNLALRVPQFRARQLITQTWLKKGVFRLQRARPRLGCWLSIIPNSQALSRSYMGAKGRRRAHPRCRSRPWRDPSLAWYATQRALSRGANY